MSTTDSGRIAAALTDLASDDTKTRQGARTALAEIGTSAVEPLLETLSTLPEAARPEALKALTKIRDPRAAEVFVRCLEDPCSDCRWLAAEGLVALGRAGLVAILDQLTEYPGNLWKLRGAHHALHGLRYVGFAEVVEPVLKAFHGNIPEIALPSAAHAALTRLRG